LQEFFPTKMQRPPSEGRIWNPRLKGEKSYSA
jgi:hypothetical protein